MPDATRPRALLIIDMISAWDFPDADKLLPQARRIAPAIARLKTRWRRAGWPVIYANDNQGRWRSDFRQLVDLAREPAVPGRDIVDLLAPDDDDYFVLKPKHSGFFCTPLDLLLQDLAIRDLVLTGVASDQCIAVTAAEARMRNYAVHVPADCVGSQSETRRRRSIELFADVMRLDVRDSRSLRLRAAHRAGPRRSA